MALTEDDQLILYRINTVSMKLIKQTSLTDALEQFAYDTNIDMSFKQEVIQTIRISCDILPSIILIVTSQFFCCLYAPNSQVISLKMFDQKILNGSKFFKFQDKVCICNIQQTPKVWSLGVIELIQISQIAKILTGGEKQN